MTRGEGACLVCGKPIIYFDKAKKNGMYHVS